MQIVKITAEGRENLYGMPGLKRRILTILLTRQMKLIEIVDYLRNAFIEYKYIKINIIALALSDLVCTDMVEYIDG